MSYTLVRSQLLGSIDDALRARARAVQVPEGQPLTEFEFTAPLLGGAGGYAQLVTAGGSVIRRPDAKIPLPSRGARRVADGTRGPFFEDATVRGTHVRILTTQYAPGIAVQIARPLDEVDQTLDRLAGYLIAISLGGIALAAFLGVLIARTAVAPVRRLTETAERVTKTRDLSERINAPGRDELGRLAASFNSMLGTLDESLRAQTQLVADASHELRTPLTSLRTNVEVLQRAHDLPEAERTRMIAEIRLQAEELSELLADLLDLSRTEHVTPEPLQFDEVVETALERTRKSANGVRFDARLEPTTVNGVSSRLERAVANLLDNAAKWSPPRRDGRGRPARRRAPRPRPRARDRRGRPPTRLRPLLPRAVGARRARLGARPRDRAAGRGGARRLGERGKRLGRRRPLPRQALTGLVIRPHAVLRFARLTLWSLTTPPRRKNRGRLLRSRPRSI